LAQGLLSIKEVNVIAAMAAAIWLTNLLLDAQTARNSVFPEGADSPVIAVGFLAMSAALDHPSL